MGQGNDTPLVLGQQLCEILSISNITVELRSGKGLSLCVHGDLDVRDMTVSQSHDTSLGHGQSKELWPRLAILAMCAV